MTKKVFIIINEQHSIMEDQKKVIQEKFPNAKLEKVAIPAKGLNLQEISELSFNLYHKAVREDAVIIMASPIPAMIKNITAMIYQIEGESQGIAKNTDIFILHNDRREKKELPNGKIVFTVAKEGWQLV